MCNHFEIAMVIRIFIGALLMCVFIGPLYAMLSCEASLKAANKSYKKMQTAFDEYDRAWHRNNKWYLGPYGCHECGRPGNKMPPNDINAIYLRNTCNDCLTQLNQYGFQKNIVSSPE